MSNNCNHIDAPSVRVNMDSGEKTWLTPLSLINSLGHFDTDPCVPDEMPWNTADKMITKEENGLTTPWVGRVWLNPPYGKEAVPFLEKMATYDGGGHCSHICTDGQSSVAQMDISIRPFGYVYSQAYQILRQKRKPTRIRRNAFGANCIFSERYRIADSKRNKWEGNYS